MIIQYLLSVALLCVLVYGLSQRVRSRFVTLLLALTTLGGGFLVWAPEVANRLAHFAGVGRGADLVLYCWVIISLAVSLDLHVRSRAQARMITELTRHLALRDAMTPVDPAQAAETAGSCRGRQDPLSATRG